MFDACDYEKMITLSNNKHLVNADITKKVPELSQKKWFAVLASPLPQRARSFVAIELKGDVPHSPGGFPASRRAARWTMAASTTGFSNRSCSPAAARSFDVSVSCGIKLMRQFETTE
jgi:hypothetical protein